MKKIIVLGCGPAGLVAAWAARQMESAVLIFAKKRKSHMYGAQYLHWPIPGVPAGNSQKIQYLMRGDEAGYRAKVYGSKWDGTVSPEDLSEEHLAWDIRVTYDELWDRFGFQVIDQEIGAPTIKLIQEEYHPDLIVSTIPAPSICLMNHQFVSQDIKAAGEAPDLGIKLPYQCPENTVICNGDPEVSWYRVSNIFGHKTVEWPEWVNPPIPSTAVVQKPLRHDCTCYPEVLRVGRYGAWRKGYLVHHVYDDVVRAIGTM